MFYHILEDVSMLVGTMEQVILQGAEIKHIHLCGFVSFAIDQN